MRNRKLSVALSLCILGFSWQAIADDETAPASEASAPANKPQEPSGSSASGAPSTAKYGNAGCGLGSLLFSPGNGFSQVWAATTNGSSGTQTFGISSGSSNCDGAGYQPGSTAAFIQSNRSALAKDIARGRGPTVSGLSELAGCHDARAVGRTLRRNFKSIFSGPEAADEQVSDSMIQVLKSDSSLACTHLG
jgi:hypothetical protein